ncbi:MAG: RHS repeat-associated core domain-containing protein [Kiritimatiellae bacterium]|nr:RHS repeat-associated core domain-containing protein [Kiritimatiellia bacterium]
MNRVMTRAQQIRMPKTRRDADTYAVTASFCTVHALVGTNVTSQPLSFPASQPRFTWQGREYSYATGLYNFRARWYDPAADRWLSKDPIGLEGGLNLYEAFGNNPVCFRDPEGEDWISDFFDEMADVINRPLDNARQNLNIMLYNIIWRGKKEEQYENEPPTLTQGKEIPQFITGDDLRELFLMGVSRGRGMGKPGMKKQGRELLHKAKNFQDYGKDRFRGGEA